MEKVKLYICCSHLYTPTVLSECFKQKGEVYIYTDKKSILDLFSHLNIPVNVYLDDIPNPNTSILKRGVKDIQKKNKIRKWVEGKVFTDVYFFHEGYCEAANWMMLFIAKKKESKFHYVPVAKSYFIDEVVPRKDIKTRLDKIYNYLMWGYIPIYPSVGSKCGLLPLNFFIHLGITSEEELPVSKDFANGLLSEEDYPSASIVLLDNPEIKNKEQFNKYKIFLDKAVRPFMNTKSILFKNHPGRTQYIGLENELKEIPSYISGNLLTRRFSTFIGVNSALLCEAANDGTKAICLVKLVDMDEERRTFLIEYHKTLSNKILFPKSIEEFNSLI